MKIRCFLPWASVCLAPFFSSALVAATTAAGTAPDLQQTHFQHPGFWRMTAIDLLAGESYIPYLVVRHTTPGGKVLLEYRAPTDWGGLPAGKGPKVSADSPEPKLLGYIWDCGTLTPIYSPAWPWIYPAEGYQGARELYFGVSDLNDSNALVGHCWATDWETLDGLALDENIGVVWPAGPGGVAGELCADLPTPTARFQSRAATPSDEIPSRLITDSLVIDNYGNCYGRLWVTKRWVAPWAADANSISFYYLNDIVKWTAPGSPPEKLTHNATGEPLRGDVPGSFIQDFHPEGHLLIGSYSRSDAPQSTYRHEVVLAGGESRYELADTAATPPRFISDSGAAYSLAATWAPGAAWDPPALDEP